LVLFLKIRAQELREVRLQVQELREVRLQVQELREVRLQVQELREVLEVQVHKEVHQLKFKLSIVEPILQLLAMFVVARSAKHITEVLSPTTFSLPLVKIAEPAIP